MSSVRVLVLSVVGLLGCGTGARDPRCPSTPPDLFASCDGLSGVECEYGDPYGRNRTSASCGVTAVGQPPVWIVDTTTVPPNPASCPATFAAAQTGSCTADAHLSCDYDEGRCACLCPDGQSAATWACRSRDDLQPHCPSLRPLAGDGCTDEGLMCSYDKFCSESPLSFGPDLICQNGYWAFGRFRGGGACSMPAC
jgi:hypothetical protein